MSGAETHVDDNYSDYQVSILEVAGSGATADEVVRLEHLWMRKLQTTSMGLDSGSDVVADALSLQP